MAKGWLKVVVAIIALGFGYGATQFWQLTRPDDSFDILLGVGVVVAIASFVSLHFLTKGSGGD